MEEEPEGINLDTINSNDHSIVLPEVENEEAESISIEETKSPDMENDSMDEDKKNLQKGVNFERKKRKEAEKKAKELQKQLESLQEAKLTPSKTTVEELVEQGVDVSIAKSIVRAIDNRKSEDTSTKKELATMKFKMDLAQKSREKGFEDIGEYEEEIKELVDKGLSLEQSYYATVYTKPSFNTKSEIERKVEAKLQTQHARKEILGNTIHSNSESNGSINAKVNATPEEKAIAAVAGMSVEEYVAIRDMSSVKDYGAYKSRKK